MTDLQHGSRVRVTLDVEATVGEDLTGRPAIDFGFDTVAVVGLERIGAKIEVLSRPPFGPGELLEGPSGHLYHLTEEGYLFVRTGEDPYRRFYRYGERSAYFAADFVEPRFRKATA